MADRLVFRQEGPHRRRGEVVVHELVIQAVQAAPPDSALGGVGDPVHDDPRQSGWIVGRTPMGRWGTPEALGGAAVYLAPEAAAFMTGQTLYVDGGFIVA